MTSKDNSLPFLDILDSMRGSLATSNDLNRLYIRIQRHKLFNASFSVSVCLDTGMIYYNFRNTDGNILNLLNCPLPWEHDEQIEKRRLLYVNLIIFENL